ncbi:c-type cytochrome [Hydrogenimonas sp.]|uniref:c-type cytochrome n=1 Tax=Hydrogenimonas sp. TaxID=2231112 RepID=UPI00261BD9DE|nr:c-type cytochrome [Hydrogenimonas sp.]
MVGSGRRSLVVGRWIRALTVGALLLGSAQLLADRGKNIYERNCVACHRKLPVALDKFFFNYLLKYSSERRVKEALQRFLKHPTKKKALASEELINQYGLMPKTELSDTELRRAIDTYWETYKVFGKIK